MITITPSHLGSLSRDPSPSSLIPAITRSEEPRIATRSLGRLERGAKRVIDLVGAGLGLLFLTPVLIAVAALIRLDSRGPILFRQIRLGLDGREFHCLKFRTMVTDAESRLDELENLNESQGGVLFKIKADPRVTKLGRFLRKTSIDELPQLWNVVRGDMSLVGPRPLQIRDCRKLIAIDPVGFERRVSVVPGITGPWQVGGRSDVDSQGMMNLDLEYVANRSLGVDLRILARTVLVVAAGRGAS